MATSSPSTAGLANADETDQRTTFRPRSIRGRAFRRALHNPTTVIGLVCVLIVLLMAIAPTFLPLDHPNVMDPLARRKPPGTDGHLLGTDSFGRDLMSRALHGARLSISIAFSVVALSTVAGILLGTVAGFRGGFVDALITRIWDVMLSLPGILLLIVIMGTLGAGVGMAILALTIASIPAAGRLVRERVMVQRRQLFVEAAQVNGASSSRIMFRHVLPNSMTSVLILAALAIPEVILAEAALSFLGLGVPPPTASWGKMIAEGQSQLLLAPWQSLIPGVCILIATLGFNLVGDGLRDLLDPTSSR